MAESDAQTALFELELDCGQDFSGTGGMRFGLAS